jgi:membrane-bound serine protease (ClpP class)
MWIERDKEITMAWFFIMCVLIVAGLILIGAEVYVPGLIVGIIGVMLLVAALVVAYIHMGFGPAVMVFLVESVMSLVVAMLAMRYFPNTRWGQKTMLSASQAGSRAAAVPSPDLIGREGVAHTILRPSGMAMIDGRRLDVVAESGMVDRGTPIRVIAIEENQIVVRPV